MNILITGSKGQLGTELKERLGEKESIFYTDRDELDITDKQAVKRYIEQNQIGMVINCAAYTAVDRAEDEPEQADAVNHLGAKYLAKYGKNIIHISTDYVFDGTGHLPYKPEDATNPVSVYGSTKLAGEKAVLQAAETALIIRTAWVYAAEGRNFVRTMLRLGRERDRLTVVTDQIGSPTHAGDLAEAIIKLLPKLENGTKALYHFTNEGVCSWYDFATAIMEESGLDCQVEPIETWQYPTKAKRPAYSVLNKTSIKKDFSLSIRHWREALRDCIREIQVQIEEKEQGKQSREADK
ncbi:MAG: dTDP-4-dehydrorhamnose reductase [Oxalobacter sp.]|nr:dTDP-4-dehydrorhamnose reductase [Oxalobacter sp.]